jgi:hypothetical protein
MKRVTKAGDLESHRILLGVYSLNYIPEIGDKILVFLKFLNICISFRR